MKDNSETGLFVASTSFNALTGTKADFVTSRYLSVLVETVPEHLRVLALAGAFPSPELANLPETAHLPPRRVKSRKMSEVFLESASLREKRALSEKNASLGKQKIATTAETHRCPGIESELRKAFQAVRIRLARSLSRRNTTYEAPQGHFSRSLSLYAIWSGLSDLDGCRGILKRDDI